MRVICSSCPDPKAPLVVRRADFLGPSSRAGVLRSAGFGFGADPGGDLPEVDAAAAAVLEYEREGGLDEALPGKLSAAGTL